MNTLGDRIKKYRNLRNMTQQYIAEMLGESSGSVIYNWEKGLGRPDCEKLGKLCDLLDVSADELLGCKSMVRCPTSAEWNAILRYRAIDEHGKKIVDSVLEIEYDRHLSAKTQKTKVLPIDFFRTPVSAGTGTFLDSEDKEIAYIPESSTAEEADYMLEIRGNSMEPTFYDGDKILVRKQDSIEIGEIGIFVINGDVYVKELNNCKLVSHNEIYKPIELKDFDSICCCGKVLGVI